MMQKSGPVAQRAQPRHTHTHTHTHVPRSRIESVCVCSVVSDSLQPHDPMDCSPPGLSAHGILQVRILEWVAISFCRGLSQPGIKHLSLVPPVLASGFFTTRPPGKPRIESIAPLWKNIFCSRGRRIGDACQGRFPEFP